MSSKYEKNYANGGYVMNYEKPGKHFTLRNQVLQFKIELQEITPSIWRRILVPADYNFWDLHVAIQDSMGWKDYHLHHFEIRGKGKRKLQGLVYLILKERETWKKFTLDGKFLYSFISMSLV